MEVSIPRDLPVRTPETEQWYKENYKWYWQNMELVPSQREDTQIDFIIKTLQEQIDISKVETVLDVGVGFGRVARPILDTFPVIDHYDGIDFSELAIKQSESFLDDHSSISGGPYDAIPGDFEELGIAESYDLVISALTLSTLPTDEQAQKWLSKMASLSKKYVVNVDYHEDSDSNIVFNIGRNYFGLYKHTRNVIEIKQFDIPNYKNVRMYICRVK